MAVWAYLAVVGSHRRPKSVRAYLGLGLIQPGISYLLFDIGLRRTSAITGGLLASMETLLAVALAVVVLREPLGRAGGVALLAGLAGAVLVSSTGSYRHESIVGDVLVLAASATSASYYLFVKKLPADDHTLSGTAYQLLASLVVAGMFAALIWPAQGSALTTASTSYLLVAVATGLVGTSVPIFLLNHCLAVVPVSTAALILTLIPVFAVATAIALLGEPLMLLNGLGGAIIIAGLVILHRWRPEAQQAPTI